MKKLSLKFFLFTLGLIILPTIICNAQTNSALNTNLSISLSPQNPTPGEQVVVSLQSYSLDLDRAKITWSINGIEKRVEQGLKDYYLQAGPAGKLITISASIEPSTGGVFAKEISFIPAGVDLIFETLSYVPPFYKGKAMNINQGTNVVVAFPEMFDQMGRKLKTNELIYTWRKDGTVLGNLSGIGKNYITFPGTIPIRDAQIEVTVSSLDKSIAANNSLLITTGSPKIIFYENSPIYGIMMNKAIKRTVQMFTDEFSVVAVPYFFSVGYSDTPDLDYSWTMNGRTVANQEPKNSFTVRQESPGSGTANIGVKISNNVRIFQFVNDSYIINFQKQ